MSKAEINNQIILLRKKVTQARVCVIKKLARDAMKLRQKKGTDAQKAKNQRKAERLAAEILSIKKVKEDEITKFALQNTLALKDILEDQKSEPLVRIMARIGNNKKFSGPIAEFKKKYPNYIEFLGPGRKKKAKIERKEKRKMKNGMSIEEDSATTNVNDVKTDETSDKEASEKGDESSNEEINVSCSEQSNSEDETGSIEANEEDESEDETGSIEAKEEDDSEDERSSIEAKQQEESENDDNDDNDNDSVVDEDIVKASKVAKIVKKKVSQKDIKTENSENRNVKKDSKKALLGKRKKAQKDEKVTTEEGPKSKILKKKSDTSKIISKQAIVKKFTDILKDNDTTLDEDQEIDTDPAKSNLKIEKEEDPFFISGDGETNYLSVALPKSKAIDPNDEYNDNYTNRFNQRKFSHQQNDYFGKGDKFKNKNSMFNTNNSDSRWNDQSRNGRFDREQKGEKPNFKKFNGEQRNNSQSFKKQSKSSFENNTNEVLHPSWEAKKKQQDILKQGFQGKKIVFGDDM